MKIRAVRKLGKNSKYSYGILIPPRIIRALKLREKQKLVIIADTKTKRIIIEDWKK
ncbi:hypothetical protein HQ544_01045 [Candidatus Falkowbacteria bacterium]|nr:hypothetical protein [Candidatus Falkowbacteria bacterium]